MRRIVVTGMGAVTPLATNVGRPGRACLAVAPPTPNLSAPNPAVGGIDFVANEPRPMEMEYAISNGFGFGGVNASALFRRWTAPVTRREHRGRS